MLLTLKEIEKIINRMPTSTIDLTKYSKIYGSRLPTLPPPPPPTHTQREFHPRIFSLSHSPPP